jgi:hypothetical protein
MGVLSINVFPMGVLSINVTESIVIPETQLSKF